MTGTISARLLLRPKVLTIAVRTASKCAKRKSKKQKMRLKASWTRKCHPRLQDCSLYQGSTQRMMALVVHFPV
jgi:hypothetical protein